MRYPMKNETFKFHFFLAIKSYVHIVENRETIKEYEAEKLPERN